MYLVETIGHLILITLEGLVGVEETEIIKKQLREIIAEDGKEEAVVSLCTQPPEAEKTTPEMHTAVQHIIDFCNDQQIRIYSYRY
jgi:hypothetical protein